MSVLARSVGNAFRNKVTNGRRRGGAGRRHRPGPVPCWWPTRQWPRKVTGAERLGGHRPDRQPGRRPGLRRRRRAADGRTGRHGSRGAERDQPSSAPRRCACATPPKPPRRRQPGSQAGRGGQGGPGGQTTTTLTTSLTAAVDAGTLGTRNQASSGTTGTTGTTQAAPAGLLPITATGIGAEVDSTGKALELTAGIGPGRLHRRVHQGAAGHHPRRKEQPHVGSTFTINDTDLHRRRPVRRRHRVRQQRPLRDPPRRPRPLPSCPVNCPR